MNPLDEIDFHDERLTPEMKLALYRMMQKREFYVDQGRSREAHGLGTGVYILWKTIVGEMPKSSMLGNL